MIKYDFKEALGRFLQNLQNKLASKDFSVPANAWTASEDPDFPFTAEIVDEAVTADHIAHFVFDKASILAAMEAVIITGDTSEGKITLLAKEAPTAELSGAYTITRRKGATE